MNKYIFGILLVLSSLAIQAQSGRIAKSTIEIYTQTDPFIENLSMEVPEEFKDASATALAVINLDSYEGSANKKVRTSFYRLLLRVNDKAAREEFSTFSFNNKSFKYFGYRDEKVYALRIIKAEGETIEIDVESLEKNADDEIAIPNLEIGDVIDYGLKVIETLVNYYCYDPRLRTLNDDFPIVYGFQRYSVDRGFFVNFMSQNGAPSLERNEELSDRRTLVYDLNYSNLKPISGEVWAPKARTEETIKFQICYYPLREAKKAPVILGDPYEVKTSSTDEEKERAIRYAFKFYFGGDTRTKYFDKWYKSNFPKGTKITDDEYMSYAFYFFRYHVLIFDPLYNAFQDDYDRRSISDEYFVKVMRKIAKDRDIPVEVVFTTDKEISTFDDILLASEFSYILRYANESGEWTYMENPTSYQTTGYFNPEFAGQDALAYDSDRQFTRITIPESTADDNLYKIDFIISPNLESKNADIDAISTSTGIFKYQLSGLGLIGVEFHEDAAKAMLPEGQADVMLENRKLQRAMLKSEENLERDPEEKRLKMKKLRSEDFDLEEYTSFEVIKAGVISDADSLIYRENYTVKDVVEKAGPSYVINLSKIALDQISFTDKEKASRRNDIYINYPKTYEYIYHINIPEGYKAYGLETFEESANSKYGSVEMHAEEKDNQVIVYLKKAYKKSFIPKEEWSTLMEFLEPAMKINDARIVLKKG